jgi:endonuclease/exonuclease/phosphatase family metal-dependent hydrolase
MTYNVHHCNPPAIKGLIDVCAIADVIISNKADIVFLQEIDVKTHRAKGMNQSLELSRLTGLQYSAFYKAIDIMGGEYGVVILSRFPLDSAVVYPLWQKGESEQRVLGISVATLPDDRKIRVACTHLDLSADIREKEIKQIELILSRGEIPVILGGDFNAEPESKEMGIMFNRFTSSTKNFVATFPNINPNKTIDYLFTRRIDKLRFISHKVITGIVASDHLPVVAEVEF